MPGSEPMASTEQATSSQSRDPDQAGRRSGPTGQATDHAGQSPRPARRGRRSGNRCRGRRSGNRRSQRSDPTDPTDPTDQAPGHADQAPGHADSARKPEPTNAQRRGQTEQAGRRQRRREREDGRWVAWVVCRELEERRADADRWAGALLLVGDVAARLVAVYVLRGRISLADGVPHLGPGR